MITPVTAAMLRCDHEDNGTRCPITLLARSPVSEKNLRGVAEARGWTCGDGDRCPMHAGLTYDHA